MTEASGLGSPPRVPIIDSHVHVWSDYPLEQLLDEQVAVGAHGAVLIQPGHLNGNHAYLDHVLRRPDHASLAAVFRLDSWSARTWLARVSSGYRGVRLVGLGKDEPWWLRDDRVWKAAAADGLVISLLVDPGQLHRISTVVEANPSVPIVIDHLGRCSVDQSGAISDLVALARWSNTYVKISALGWLSRNTPPPYVDLSDLILRARHAYGTSRLLWGSDYPHVLEYGTYGLALAAARTHLASLTVTELGAVLGGNTRRLYGLGD